METVIVCDDRGAHTEHNERPYPFNEMSYTV